MKGKLFLGLIVAVYLMLPAQLVQAFDPGAWFARKVYEVDQKMADNKGYNNFSAGQAGSRTGGGETLRYLQADKKISEIRNRKKQKAQALGLEQAFLKTGIETKNLFLSRAARQLCSYSSTLYPTPRMFRMNLASGPSFSRK
jgi:hypothetical protein